MFLTQKKNLVEIRCGHVDDEQIHPRKQSMLSWENARALYARLCDRADEELWWDVVCVLAHDELQRLFFESMLASRRSSRLLPRGSVSSPTEYVVVSCGICNSSDVKLRILEPLSHIERVLQQHGGSSAKLTDKRVLVVDGAGYATRIPNLNIKGTLFSPLPANVRVPGLPVGTVFDYKMIELAPVAQKCCAGIFLTSGDLCGPYMPALQDTKFEHAMTRVPFGDQEIFTMLLDSPIVQKIGLESLSDYSLRMRNCAASLGIITSGARTRASCSCVDAECRVSASVSLLASTLSNTQVDADACVEFSRVLGSCAHPHSIGKRAIVSSIFYHPSHPDLTGTSAPPLIVPPGVLLMSCSTSKGIATLFFGIADDLNISQTVFPVCSDPTVSVALALSHLHRMLGNTDLSLEYSRFCAQVILHCSLWNPTCFKQAEIHVLLTVPQGLRLDLLYKISDI